MRRLLVAMAGAVVLAAGAPASAQASQTVGIRIVDVPTSRTDDPRARQYIVDHLAPGATITRRVEVSNDTPASQVVQLYAGAASIVDGNIVFGEGRAANDLTGWTTVDPPTVTLAAGGKATAAVKIAVPATASPGERYGVVWAELAPAVPTGGGVTAINRVGVRIYLSVGPGGEPVSDFAITAFEARRADDGSPVLAATVRNTGGRAVDLSGELRLTNGPGGLSAGPFPAKLGTTLGVEQTAPVLVPLDPAIPPGPWHARIVLRSGTTERDATANVTFPEPAATSAGPVEPRSRSGSGWSILVLLAIGAVVAVALALGLVLARRRRPSPVRPGSAG
jgi:hypothetical protein